MSQAALDRDPTDVEAASTLYDNILRIDPEAFTEVTREVQGRIAQKEEEQVRQEVQRSLGILNAIDNGYVEEAISAIDDEIAASDDPEDIEGLRELRKMVEDGDLNEAKRDLSLTIYATEQVYGGTAMKFRNESRQAELEERRQDFNEQMDVIQTGLKLEISPEEQDRLFQQIASDPNPERRARARGVLNYATLVSENPDAMDPEFVLTEIGRLNNDWESRRQVLRDSEDQYAAIQSAYEVANTALNDNIEERNFTLPDGSQVLVQAGAADIALLTAFQRQIDDAVVRQSDFENFAGANSWVDRATQAFRKAAEGPMITPEQRNTMLALSGEFVSFDRQDVITNVYPAIDAQLQILTGGPSELQREGVFGDFDINTIRNIPKGFEDARNPYED